MRECVKMKVKIELIQQTKPYFISFVMYTCMLIGACTQPLDEQAIVKARFNHKAREYAIQKNKECHIKAYEAANVYVDSIIQEFIGREVLDTIHFPKKPQRPEKPDHIIGTVKKF